MPPDFIAHCRQAVSRQSGRLSMLQRSIEGVSMLRHTLFPRHRCAGVHHALQTPSSRLCQINGLPVRPFSMAWVSLCCRC